MLLSSWSLAWPWDLLWPIKTGEKGLVLVFKRLQFCSQFFLPVFIYYNQIDTARPLSTITLEFFASISPHLKKKIQQWFLPPDFSKQINDIRMCLLYIAFYRNRFCYIHMYRVHFHVSFLDFKLHKCWHFISFIMCSSNQ